MENWAESINKTIDIKLAGTRDKELRFYRIDEFKRNINRIGSFAENCEFCKNQKTTISDITNKLDEAVKVPGESRRVYDRLISHLSQHIRKEHGFYAPYYFSYLYSFFGIVIGLIVGYILMKIKPDMLIEMLSVGFIIGLIPGYVWGFLKDKKIRSENRLM